VHLRLRAERGKATDRACVRCPNAATQWSYDHADPSPSTDKRGRPYSTDLSHYQPMCTTCHRRFDVEHMPVVTCTAEGCERPQKARGLCPAHYQRPRAL